MYRNGESIENCQETNQRIKEYLFWYNIQKYHKSLNYQTPI
ncbi:MAG: integrase core domain-containing protein [Endomicrobium sp.]|jgi:hypothetical protein|nr:integrase core domain-containing protein [Endomicrobium sp.]